jgi:hypothetical protein
MGKKVLGLDLAKTALPDAIAAMVEAWYEAQNVDGDLIKSTADRQPTGQFIAETYSAVVNCLITQAEFARLAGVSRSAITQAIGKGLITEIVEQNGKILIKKNEALQEYQSNNRKQNHKKAAILTHEHSFAYGVNSTKGAELIEAKTGRACSRQNMEKLCSKGALQGSPCILHANPLRLDPGLLVDEYLAKLGQYSWHRP